MVSVVYRRVRRLAVPGENCWTIIAVKLLLDDGTVVAHMSADTRFTSPEHTIHKSFMTCVRVCVCVCACVRIHSSGCVRVVGYPSLHDTFSFEQHFLGSGTGAK